MRFIYWPCFDPLDQATLTHLSLAVWFFFFVRSLHLYFMPLRFLLVFLISELPIKFKHFILNGLKKSSRNSILQPIIKVPYSHLNPEKLELSQLELSQTLFNSLCTFQLFMYYLLSLLYSFSFISTIFVLI